MDSLWLEYTWTLLVLIGLEGVLSADNALVIAVIAKHLPNNEKKRAINYGILIAFFFRFITIFLISFLANVWQVQAIGATYLIFIGSKHIYMTYFRSHNDPNDKRVEKKKSGFWFTVVQIGFADIAFAIDSVLAAVALAVTLPETMLPQFGGLDGAKFAIVVAGTIAGLILIKYAASWFIKLLDKRPSLETVAFLIVAWVGVKLAIISLSHPKVGILSESFPHSTAWTVTFWGVLIGIAVIGWFLSGRNISRKKM